MPSELGEYRGLQESNDFKMLYPDGRSYEVEEWPLIRSITSGEEVRDEEIVYLLPDGRRSTVRYDSSPIYDEEGRVVAGVVVGYDITEQKRSEEALQESNRQIENILERITDEFYAFDREWRFTYINERALRRIQRVEGEELLGMNIWEAYPELVDTPAYPKYHEALRERKSVEFEMYSPVTDRWIELHVYPTEEGISVFFQDITGRKEAQKEIERRTHEQAVVAELGLKAMANDDLQLLMDEAVALVARTLQVKYSKIVELLPGARSC